MTDDNNICYYVDI